MSDFNIRDVKHSKQFHEFDDLLDDFIINNRKNDNFDAGFVAFLCHVISMSIVKKISKEELIEIVSNEYDIFKNIIQKFTKQE